jgi:SAM-dependent methyltransferase
LPDQSHPNTGDFGLLSLEQQNALREQYHRERPDWVPATELYASLAQDYLQPNDRLLDLGCGRGGLVEQLSHPLPQCVGVDPDLASLQQHRLALPRAQALGRQLPFHAGSFDIILASWLLEHLDRPGAVFAEVARALRGGGTFIFITPNRRHPLALFNRLLGRASSLQGILVRRLYGRAPDDTFPTWYRANAQRDLDHLAATSDMRLAKLYFVGDPTYLAFTPRLFAAACVLEDRLPPGRRVHLVGVMQKFSA